MSLDSESRSCHWHYSDEVQALRGLGAMVGEMDWSPCGDNVAPHLLVGFFPATLFAVATNDTHIAF
jgi:hypothetical protein